MTQTRQHLVALISSDMYRYHGRANFREFVTLLLQERGFVATCMYRITRFFYVNRRSVLLSIMKLIYRLTQEFLKFEISYKTPIGSGLRIDHLTGLVISQHAKLGENINLSHQVTLGLKPSGKQAGAPVLKNNIYIAPGAKIIGGISLNSGTAVGANAVVTKDTALSSVMAGIPAKSIGTQGSIDYCLFTDYKDTIPNLPDSSCY